jgi:hypothetical protein
MIQYNGDLVYILIKFGIHTELLQLITYVGRFQPFIGHKGP